MILPATYLPALLLAILSILCWGSWANTCKLAKQRFELFYWDFSLGAILAAAIAAWTFGSMGFNLGGDVSGFAFLDDVARSSKHSMAFGLAAGVVFNLGSILLVAAIALSGMSLALPVGLGLAVATGLVVDSILKPHVNTAPLFMAIVPILAAVAVIIVAYRVISLDRARTAIRTGKTRSTKVTASWKPIVLAAIGGPLIALCSPLVDLGREPELGMGPYTAAVMFAAGIFLSTFVYNLFFMNLPVEGEPVELLFYFRQPKRRHLLPLAGGLVWGAGLVSYFVATSATAAANATAVPVPLLPPSTGYLTVLAATLLSALWGLVVWKEFDGAHSRVRMLVAAMLLLFAAALALILVSPPLSA